MEGARDKVVSRPATHPPPPSYLKLDLTNSPTISYFLSSTNPTSLLTRIVEKNSGKVSTNLALFTRILPAFITLPLQGQPIANHIKGEDSGAGARLGQHIKNKKRREGKKACVLPSKGNAIGEQTDIIE